MNHEPSSTSRKILDAPVAVGKLRELKRAGQRIVFTNGCFDLIHPGHTRYLAQARKQGDCLVVAVNSDESARTLKGPQRPVFPQSERAEILAALEAVDYVTFFDEPTPRSLIAQILPDVLVKGADWGSDQIVGREEVEAAGGKVVSMPVVKGYSTTAIIEAVLQATRSDQKS
ncbi:MAG: D-glycero-beta-D-manno-heptose 1-phosphate adenylyltransferase [Terriglobia bacterium]